MNVQESLNKFSKNAKRVLKVSRKPDAEEYRELAKITTLGVIVIGGLGYIMVGLGALLGI